MKYYKVKNKSTQYDDLEDTHVVEARYVPAKQPSDAGNPCIEAMVPLQEQDDIDLDYEKMLLDYDINKVAKMSDFDRAQAVSMLLSLRFPLPFQWDLVFHLHEAILTSYRSRELRPTGKKGILYTINDTEERATARSVGDSSKPTNAGVALTGLSGCGKSASVDLVLSRWPQVYIHNTEKGRFIQVLYVVVVCSPNSNFTALAHDFGAALDTALNNSEPVFEKEIRSARSLGEKFAKIADLVNKFSIGLIVFDEIQQIKFDRTSENSIESLLTLANKTKVAIAVVGTEDAEEKMFKVHRTARRIGPPIHADGYCGDKRYFSLLVRKLMEYQWFDEPVKVTQDIIDAFYDVTHGIVERLVSVYSYMHYEYLDKKKRPAINGDFVRMVDEKYFPGMQKILNNADDAETRMREIQADAEVKAAAIIERARQAEYMDASVENADEAAVRRATLRRVVRSITPLYPEYTDVLIKNAFDHVIKLKSAEGKSEDEIARMVLDRLKAQPKKRTKKTTPALTREQMHDMLHIGDAPKEENDT